MQRQASRRKRCMLLGVLVVVLGVVVIAVVLSLTLRDSGQHFRSTVIDRCETYLRENSDVSRENDCERIWGAFEQAYVGRDPCDVAAQEYEPLISSITQHLICDTMLFWSKTNVMAHAFTDNRECLSTLEDTLLGFIFDGLTWCSKNGSRETFTTDCPGWSDCQNNPVRSFWIRASANFAATSCGNVSAMLNGSLESPFSSTSIFGSVEVKNLNPDKVDSLTVLLVTKDTDTTTCASSSFNSLQSALDPKIGYNCRQVPYAQVEGCIADLEIPCSDCL